MIFFVTCCLCQSSIATGRAGPDGAYILGRAGAGERRPVLGAWEGWVGIAGEEERQLRGTGHYRAVASAAHGSVHIAALHNCAAEWGGG